MNRRDFIRSTIAVAAGLALAGKALTAPAHETINLPTVEYRSMPDDEVGFATRHYWLYSKGNNHYHYGFIILDDVPDSTLEQIMEQHRQRAYEAFTHI